MWAEAAGTAITLYNVTPHSAINFKTPYEARYQEKPDISQIRIFGSLGFRKIENPKSKLDEKSQPCHVIGFGHNQYKCIDFTRNNRIFWARDVVIVENTLSSKYISNNTNFTTSSGTSGEFGNPTTSSGTSPDPTTSGKIYFRVQLSW